jgi:F-type H+-transporting ATPase subunit delta
MSETQTPQAHHPTVLDDETRHVARVYSEALYAAAEKANDVEGVLADLEGLVNGVFKADPGLEAYFQSAGVNRERKAEALKGAFEGRATPTFVSFLDVLNAHGRLGMARAIAGAYHAIHERKNKRVPVHVRSAVPLTEGERTRLVADIRAVADLEPVLEESIDPSILGGLIVRVRDWVYDASVRMRLETIKDQLIERSSHAVERSRDRFGSHA